MRGREVGERSSSGMKLIDTHAHLDQIEDLEAALGRAGEVGVSAIIAVSVSGESSRETLRIAEGEGGEEVGIYPALGVHPWSLKAEDFEDSYEFIKRNVGRAVAIGEVGLDFWLPKARKDLEFREFQIECLRRFIELSEEHSKPILIHSRGAWQEAYETIRRSNVDKVIFHWFSGSKTTLSNLIEKGYYISASPAAQYSKAHRSAIEYAPLERIVLETDSPVRYGGEKSEPSLLTKTLEAVAEIKSVDAREVAERTTLNARQIFGLENLM